jgi:adducin
MREMERRKRVEMVMNSRLFREELERIIEIQMKDGGGPAGLLQQISDMMGVQGGRLHSGHMFKSEYSPLCIHVCGTRVSVMSFKFPLLSFF